MEICELLRNLPVKSIQNHQSIDVKGIAFDSREVREGFLFVCLKGEKSDGHEHISEAQRNGAVAVMTERSTETELMQIIVKDTRRSLALVSANFYGNPADDLAIVTVVGTNGKTSTVEILSEIFLAAGRKCATIGTLGYKIGRERYDGCLTTPDPIELHKNLANMQKSGVEFVFVEASAHAIHFEKLAGIKAKSTVFTNLTQDHLDFFHTMEEYANVKLGYFNLNNTALAVVNSDDPYGRRILMEQKVPTITYGIDNPADVFAINVEEGEEGLRFTINAFDRIEEIRTPLFGRFNVYNVMAAISTAMYLGVGLPVAKMALEKMHTVPGRFSAKIMKGRKVVVDYAHTPDGLQNLLGSFVGRKGKLITVFGCGGDRDRSKRPLMGKIAARYSDHVIITDDNPRSEDEMDIAREIKQGISPKNSVEICLNRKEAILRAFAVSAPGDIVVIAGKGHEKYMEIKGKKIPYSDAAILEELNR